MRALALSLLVTLVACGDGEGSGGAGGSPVSSSSGGSSSSGTAGMGEGASAGAGGEGGLGGGGSAGSAQGGAGGQGGLGGAGGSAPDYYGLISGTCGEVNLDDIASPAPEYLENTLDLSGEPALQPEMLSPGGQQIFADGNLGGSSLYSEIFAYEVLFRCEGAEYLKGEAEIVYQTEGKKTDLLVGIDGEKVGVSVVRAVSFPEGTAYPVSQALNVLEGKLSDILQSSMNVAPEDAWEKQILAVIAQTDEHAASLVAAYDMIDPAIKADTIVYVTVTNGDDYFIYYNN